jgi:hypothetical protein
LLNDVFSLGMTLLIVHKGSILDTDNFNTDENALSSYLESIDSLENKEFVKLLKQML